MFFHRNHIRWEKVNTNRGLPPLSRSKRQAQLKSPRPRRLLWTLGLGGNVWGGVLFFSTHLSAPLGGLALSLFTACTLPSHQDETKSTSDEITSETEEASDTTLDTENSEWESCEPSPDDPFFVGPGLGYGGKPPWKFDPPPAIEVAQCDHLSLVESETKSKKIAITLYADCQDEEQNTHSMQFSFGYAPQIRSQLQILLAPTELRIEFQNPDIGHHYRHQSIRIFDPQGHLLLLGHSYGGGYQDEMLLGIPLGWEEASTWLAPFQAFAFRGQLCPETPAYKDAGWPQSTIRRAAIDVHTDEGTTRIFDRSSASLRAEGIDFDVFVGTTYQITKFACGGCLPAYARFLAIRTTPLP